jgi:acetyl esterase/lipase
MPTTAASLTPASRASVVSRSRFPVADSRHSAHAGTVHRSCARLVIRRLVAASAAAVALLAPPGASASTNDLVVPAVGPQHGTVVLLHPGGWIGGSQTDEAVLAQLLSLHGWRSVSLAYPLWNLPAAYSAATEATRTWRRPGQPLVAIGESAGGGIAEWLAARRRVDSAFAVGGPADFRTWRLIQPGAPWAFWPAAVGIGGQLWRWSPARVFEAERSAPLVVYQSLDDQVVEPAQAREMKARGAEVHWLRGSHLTDTSWQSDVLARLGATTRP